MASSSLNLSPSPPRAISKAQPPYLKSSDPPGSSITPSSDTNSVTTTRPTLASFRRHLPPAPRLTWSTYQLINRGGEHVPVDQLSTTFGALADPTRRAILARLAGGEATVKELAEPFPITVQAVSKHLRVLERAGLIERGRTAQLRPSRLRGRPLKEAAEWLEPYSRFWGGSVDPLDARLRGGQNGPQDGRGLP